MYNRIVIGIDQSYENTGISVCADGAILRLMSSNLGKLTNNTDKRLRLAHDLRVVINKVMYKANSICIIMERIRLSSQGFVNINYIKSIGALNAVIVDVAKEFGIDTYSVDTRSWKANIVGTSKPQKNKYGIDPNKWPTIKHVIKLGLEDRLLIEASAQKKKGVIIKDGKPYTYDNDRSDAACISLYGFLDKGLQKLEEEH